MSDSFATPCTVAHQTSLSMGFPRQEYWSELLFPSPGDLPDPGMEPVAPVLAGRFLTTELPASVCVCVCIYIYIYIYTCIYIYSVNHLALRLFHGKVLVTVDWVMSLLTVQSHYYGEE